MNARILRLVAIVFFVGALSACGFQLRGSDMLPPTVESLHIQSSDNTRFVKALRRTMVRRGVRLTNSAADATAELRILNDDSGQRILSVAVTEGPEEYEVFQVVTITFSINGEPVISPSTFTLTRDYTYDKNDILGKRHEYETLRNALAVEMAETIVRRIRYANNPPST